MFARVLKNKPVELLIRSFSTKSNVAAKYVPNATLTNGTKGINVLPGIFKTYAQQLPKGIAASFTSTFMMWGWCVAIMVLSDVVNDVPFGFQRTAALRVVKYGDKPEVEFV
ncbi:hypothetical protein G9P44_004024 [Scheffersomyces stipitis]|nr:hypothetical protein G9P44_004024 [Scheffersomyces stipitis]